MQITENVRSFIYNCRRRGKAYDVIAEALTDFSGEDFTADAVEQIWEAMVSGGWVKKKRSSKKSDAGIPASKDPVHDRWDLMRRNVLHLVDLKRAGHSPTRTEYKITPEGKGVRYRTVDTCSYLGSSAASCAAEV